MPKISYQIVPLTTYVLKRTTENARRDKGVHIEDVGLFDTEAKAQEFADQLKALDDEPGHDVGKRWAYGETKTA